MDLIHKGGNEPVRGGIAEPPVFEWPGGLRPRVFISYRRALSPDYASSLRRELEHELPGQVFMDSTFIRAGWDWSQWIDRALTTPELRVVVCIVHTHFWTHPRERDPSATPRLWEEDDVVLRELRIAHDRWKQEKDEGFNLILAPQSEHYTLPSIEDGMPEWTRAALEGLAKANLVSEHRLNSDLGFDALVKTIVEDVDRLGAVSHSKVKTLSELALMTDATRHSLRTSLERRLAQGDRDPRTVALAAALIVIDRGYDAARELLRRNWSVFTPGPGEAAYWKALAAVTLAASELRGESPRKLASLKLARELARELEDALVSLHAQEAELERARFSDAAKQTGSVVGIVLGGLIQRYFDGRGISLTREGGVLDMKHRANALLWVKWAVSRTPVTELDPVARAWPVHDLVGAGLTAELGTG